MKKAMAMAALFFVFVSPADAQAILPLLVDAPCPWFVKTAPFVWSTNHVIRVDTWGVVAGPLSVTPGHYRVDDGTDAYEFIERKCGHGATPDPAYRAAMPLPFGLLPWYQ
jgi:hypothetical protein